MSGLSEKLHELITKLHGGTEVVHDDVDALVKTLSDHFLATVVPAVEDVVKKAVADSIQFERDEAQKIADELHATYEKLVASHGVDVANQAVADAHAVATAESKTA